MNQDQLLKQVKVERAEFEARLDEVEDAKRRYHQAIKRLYDAGMPLRDIADAVGLSHQRVHQIVGDGSLRGRVARKVAKNARAGGAR